MRQDLNSSNNPVSGSDSSTGFAGQSQTNDPAMNFNSPPNTVNTLGSSYSENNPNSSGTDNTTTSFPSTANTTTASFSAAVSPTFNTNSTVPSNNNILQQQMSRTVNEPVLSSATVSNSNNGFTPVLQTNVQQPTQVQPVVQNFSPLDTPPAPPSQAPSAQQPDLSQTVVDNKPKKKAPVFLLILLLLVVIVLSAVGFLAYQNYKMDKNIRLPFVGGNVLSTPIPENVKQNEENYILHKSNVLPLEFQIPSGWKVDTTSQDMANQKMISVTSPDFSYAETEIAKGFEFRVGPVDDLTKRYDSFEAYSAEENTGGIYKIQVINETKWLVKGNEAKTLVDNTPMVVAMYSNPVESAQALEIFTKILASIKISVSTPAVNTSTPSATSGE